MHVCVCVWCDIISSPFTLDWFVEDCGAPSTESKLDTAAAAEVTMNNNENNGLIQRALEKKTDTFH